MTKSSTRIATEAWDHLFTYKIFTSFHGSFPAIDVTYRIDGKRYGEDMPIDISYGSGGIEEPVGMDEYIRFTKEMAEAWAAAGKIIKHHKKSKKVYRE